MEYPSGLSAVHFIRLKLTRGGEAVSENFYWRGLEEGDYRALRELPKVRLEAATRVERQGSRWLLTTELHNVSAQPALMVRLKAVREKSGDRILPALYSDNYVALMPGERRTIGRGGGRRHAGREAASGGGRVQRRRGGGEIASEVGSK